MSAGKPGCKFCSYYEKELAELRATIEALEEKFELLENDLFEKGVGVEEPIDWEAKLLYPPPRMLQ